MVICTRKFIIGDFLCVKVTKAKSWAEKGDDKDIFFSSSPFRLSPSLSIFFLLYAVFFLVARHH